MLRSIVQNRIIIILSIILVYFTQCQNFSSNDYMQELSIEPDVIGFTGPVSINENSISFEIEFNKDMNTFSVESAMSLVRRDFEKWDALSNMAIFEWSNNKHVKVSIPKLPLNTAFLYKINTSAITLYGNRPLLKPYYKDIMLSISDNDRPYVKSYNPTIDVPAPINARIMVTFNKPMKRSTLLDAFTVYDSSDKTVQGGIYYDEVGKTINFMPFYNMSSSTSYHATITTEAKDLFSIPLSQDFTFTFCTGSNVDINAPTVLSITDNNNGQPRYTYTPIGIWFSEQMNFNYLPSSVTIMQGTTPITIGSYHFEADNSFWLHPNDILSANTVYTVTVDSQAIDLAGNPISNAPYIFQISLLQDTTPPVIISSAPLNTSFTNSINSVIMLYFSKGMDKTSVDSAFNCKEVISNVSTLGTFSWQGDTIVTFTPTNPLSYNTEYQYSLGITAKDKSGNYLQQDYRAKFTTFPQTSTSTPITLAVPILSSGAVTSTSVILNWTTSTGADGYDIYFTLGSCSTETLYHYTKITSTSSAVIEPLQPNTAYSYYIKAYNSDAESDYSNCCHITTSTSTIINQVPTGQITSPVDGICSTSNTFVITGTANDIDGIIQVVNVMVDGGNIPTSGTTDWTATATLLSNGAHSISLVVYDNEGSSSLSQNITISSDTTSTLIYVNTPSSSYNQCNYSIPLSGTYSVSSCKSKTLQYNIDGGTWVNISSIGSGVWTDTITSGISGTGYHSISIRIVDSFSGENELTKTFSTYYTQPKVELISPSNGQTIDMTSSVILSGTYSNAATCCTNKTIQFSVDGSTTWTNASTIGTVYWTHTPLSGSSFSEGNHTVSVKIRNDCNMSYTSSVITFYVSFLGIKWILIPSGTLMLGSTFGDTTLTTYATLSTPQHLITLSSYYLTETEVTIAQYIAFLNAVEWSSTDVSGTSALGRFNIAMSNNIYCGINRLGTSGSYSYSVINGTWSEHPINHVTWTNACEFCNWISGTLPSEAQWEFACGGANHYLWSLGDTFSSSAYCYSKSISCAVKSYPANSYGLYDMSGGVYEWCMDWYSTPSITSGSIPGNYYYQCCFTGSCSSINPVNLYSGLSYRVLRGGCWIETAGTFLRSSYRYNGTLNSHSPGTGIRCSRQ